jgi:hypothetical protein
MENPNKTLSNRPTTKLLICKGNSTISRKDLVIFFLGQ